MKTSSICRFLVVLVGNRVGKYKGSTNKKGLRFLSSPLIDTGSGDRI